MEKLMELAASYHIDIHGPLPSQPQAWSRTLVHAPK
jgi:hypothetical protein